ncbi:MAG: MarR family winged helix-turn-helix transcriptional regulator [Thermovirgaceae bacterium]
MSDEIQVRAVRDNLNRIVRAMGLLESGRADCCKLTIAECHCLTVLGRAGDLSVTELAGMLGVDKSTASRLADSLVSEELAERRPGYPDRRYVRLALTEAGREHYESVEKLMDGYFRRVLQEIPEAGRKSLAEGLEFLTKALEAIDPPDGKAQSFSCSKGVR